MKKSDLLRNQEHPTVFGYELDRETLLAATREGDAMNKPIHSVWKVKYGSRYEWKVQCPCGILTFKTRKNAVNYALAAEELRRKGHGC